MKVKDAPTQPGAYMDDQRRIWLLERLVTNHMRWRLPGGFVTQPNNRAFEVALKGVKELRRMVPVRKL